MWHQETWRRCEELVPLIPHVLSLCQSEQIHVYGHLADDLILIKLKGLNGVPGYDTQENANLERKGVMNKSCLPSSLTLSSRDSCTCGVALQDGNKE